MSEPDRPAWHWDEQAALRDELAEQAETAAVIRASLEAEIARLEAEKAELVAEAERWRRAAESAEQRETIAVKALARLLRTYQPG